MDTRRLPIAAVLACALLLGLVAEARAARTFHIDGWTQGLAVDGRHAFTLRRTDRPFVVRVDLLNGAKSVVFRTDAFPDEELFAGGGRVALDLDVPHAGADAVSQVVTFPAAGGAATVLREGRLTRLGDDDDPEACGTRVDLGGVTSLGEVLISEGRVPCGGAQPGTGTLVASGPFGDRTLLTRPLAELEGYGGPGFQEAGPWQLWEERTSLRLVNTQTGHRQLIRGALSAPRGTLGPDGRVVTREVRVRARGGYVQRVRVVRPGDPPLGGRVLGTVGTPPRLDATWCGDRLVELHTAARTTRVLVDGRPLTHVRTIADPRFACTADHLVVQGLDLEDTALHVITLPGH